MFSMLKLGAVLAILGGLLTSHYWAYNRGRENERAAALERSIELIKERSRINDEIGDLDDADLCRELGGQWLPDEARCE